MNNFGLGLVLNFTDNATSQIQRATGAFNQLDSTTQQFASANSAESAFASIAAGAGILGESLYRTGSQITSFFTGLTQQITNTGSTILAARSQLSTLYQSAEAGESVLAKIKNYAASSIFNFEDLLPSVIMLKANGIEAFDDIATSAYRASNGVEGYSQKLMDYASDLAAFNPQMHNMYGSGVQAAIGAISEYIAEGNAMSLKRGASLDILQILGEEKGKTIEERSRQVADLLEKLNMVGMTAGLAGQPMQRLSNLQDLVFNTMTKISDSGVYDKFSELVEKISEFLMVDVKEEEWDNLAEVIGSALVELMDLLHPVLDILIQVANIVREFVKTNPELLKTIIKFTALSGVMLVLSGAILKVLSSLGMLRFSISQLFKGFSLFNGGGFLGLLKNFALYILPIISQITLLKDAWNRDFMGMQGGLAKFAKDTWDSMKLVGDAFTDNTLTGEGFARAKELGILPFIEALLQLKYHWGILKEGFNKGLDEFWDNLSKILTKLGIFDHDIHSLRDLVTAFLDKITAPGLEDNWEKLGYVIGKFGPWILMIAGLIPVITKIIGLVKILIPIVKTLWAILTWQQGLGAIIIAVIALAIIIYKNWDEISAFIRDTYIKIGAWVIGLAQKVQQWWNDTVQSIATFWMGKWAALVEWWNDVTQLLSFAWKLLCSNIKQWWDDTVQSVADFWKGVWDAVVQWFNNTVQSVKDFFTGIWNSVVDWFFGTIHKIEDWWNGIVSYWKSIPQRIRNWVFNEIVNPIFNGITEKWNAMINKINEFKTNAINAFQEVGDFFHNIFEGVGNFFDSIFSGISDRLNSLKQWASNINPFSSNDEGGNVVTNGIKNAFGSIKSMVGLATGGYVKTKGVALLHPNEVVVNDRLTQGLEAFLNDYQQLRNITSPVINISNSTPVRLPAENNDNNSNNNNDNSNNTGLVTSYVSNNNTYNSIMNNSTEGDTVTNNSNSAPQDNRVIFESGSVVFNVDKNTDLSDEGLKAMADKLMTIMSRKLQLRGLQTRA